MSCSEAAMALARASSSSCSDPFPCNAAVSALVPPPLPLAVCAAILLAVAFDCDVGDLHLPSRVLQGDNHLKGGHHYRPYQHQSCSGLPTMPGNMSFNTTTIGEIKGHHNCWLCDDRLSQLLYSKGSSKLPSLVLCCLFCCYCRGYFVCMCTRNN